MNTPLQPWPTQESVTEYSTRVFDVVRHRRTSPRSGRAHDFYVLDACDWVNIIPLTHDNEVVMIRQFRHGTGNFTLEIPGGMVDDTDPSPQHAAVRELAEETGYAPDEVVPLGCVHPNPAIQDNLCHTFLARGARQVATPRFDGTEDIEVLLVPLAEIPHYTPRGQITHALVVAAFHWLALHNHSAQAVNQGPSDF